MPRTARATPGGYFYHVLNRGNARRAVFHKDVDYAAFGRLLREAHAWMPPSGSSHGPDYLLSTPLSPPSAIRPPNRRQNPYTLPPRTPGPLPAEDGVRGAVENLSPHPLTDRRRFG